MKISDSITARGQVTISKLNKNQEVLDQFVINNMIVDTGWNWIRDKILSRNTSEKIFFIGIGDGLKPVESTDVFLSPSAEQEADDEYIHMTSKQEIRFAEPNIFDTNEIVIESCWPEIPDNTYKYHGLFNNFVISEIGLFTDTPYLWSHPDYPDRTYEHRLIARVLIDKDYRFRKTKEEFLSVSWSIKIG